MARGKAPAWQVRDTERRKLLDQLQSEMFLFAETWTEGEDSCFMHLLHIFPEERGWILHEHDDSKDPARSFLVKVFKRIDQFGRSPREKNALSFRFLQEFVLPRISSRFQGELQREEIFEPMMIFGVERATEEIPLPED